MSHAPIRPDWSGSSYTDDQPEPEPEQVPGQIAIDPTVACTGCGAWSRLSLLSSKYGPPQVLAPLGNGRRLWEAKCASCDKKKHAGMQAIWKESR